MNLKDFEELVESQFSECRRVLYFKGKEYADESDRLHNFKVAASLQNETPTQALCGMLAKHIVSIYDLARRNGVEMFVWDEKIGDAINYLLLLKALVAEDEELFLQEEERIKEESYLTSEV